MFEHCYPFGQIHNFLFLEKQTTFKTIFKQSLSIDICLNTATRLKTLCFTSLKWIIQYNGLLAQDLCLATNAQRAKPMQQPQQLDTQTATGKQKQTTQTPTRSPEYQPLTQTSSSSQAPTRQPLPSQIKEGNRLTQTTSSSQRPTRQPPPAKIKDKQYSRQDSHHQAISRKETDSPRQAVAAKYPQDSHYHAKSRKEAGHKHLPDHLSTTHWPTQAAADKTATTRQNAGRKKRENLKYCLN